MKRGIIVFMLLSCGLIGCGTINAEREGYMKDSERVKEQYLGDAVSSPVFLRYELRGKYAVSDGKLQLYVDPVEVYEQNKESFVVREKVTYERYGPYRYSPVGCVFGVVTVFPLLFSIIDDDYADSLKKSCYKVYEWEREAKELEPERAGASAVEVVTRQYADNQGAVDYELYAGGKRVDHSGLTGFTGSGRNGAYLWIVNDWFDFSRLDPESSLLVRVTNRRDGAVLRNEYSLSKEEAEALLFRSHYDGLFQLYYVCRLCNANLEDNFYTDAQRIVWFGDVYRYKGKGSLGILTSCIEGRFDHLKNGSVRMMEADTPKGASHWYQTYSSYGSVRGVTPPSAPSIDDIRSCIQTKRLDLKVENHH